MDKLIYLAFLFLLISCSTEKQNIEHLIFKNEIAFKPDSDKPYTGAVFQLKNNGKIDFEGYFANGKKDGEFITYGENELIKEKENYKDGKRHGESLSYYETGELWNKKSYINDHEDGLFERYDENGNKIFEGSYSKGFEIGKHKYWFENGNQIRLELEYSEGLIIIESVKEYYIEGKIKSEFKRLAKNHFEMIEYHLNGNIKHYLKYLYESDACGIGCRFFTFTNSATIHTQGVSFDIGSFFTKKIDDEYFKNESGKIIEMTKHFYPNYGSVSKKNYFGKTDINDGVTRYSEYFDNDGMLIKKCVRYYWTAELDCVPNNWEKTKLDDIQLVGVSGGK
ncbi:hypothetical protein PDL71_17085 [Lacibacter sp. MH-610]|uniref:toxin-antitoxin system YwqK family antitoxin n=1 Tax=Lacibacter sp. MH-610 TaxID=3020883 RepID=UPI003892091D